MDATRWPFSILPATALLVGSCATEPEIDDQPSECVSGQFCPAPLVCVDGLCVSSTGETGDGDPTGDGDGDPTGDGDGDPTGDGDGDPTGDGDGDPTGDGDGDPTGDGDGDPTGDGDGDPTGDGDGDPGTACAGDEFIAIEAEDADEVDGWDPIMSTVGEGMVLGWDNVNYDAYATWNIDVPCDDTWHIWVRAINAADRDSFFASVDGQPNPSAIFDIACDPGPEMATYQWRELNWRDPRQGACLYVEDPWLQDWTAGMHELTLSYRESYSLSKLWITNTNQAPP